MKTLFVYYLRLVLNTLALTALMLAIPVIAFAAPALQEQANPLTDLLAFLGDLGLKLAPYGGWAALVTFLVGLGKQFGIVKAGQAGIWNAGLNLVGAGGLYYIINYTTVQPGEVDTLLGQVAAIGVAIVALFGQIGASKAFHLMAKWAGVSGLGLDMPRGPQA